MSGLPKFSIIMPVLNRADTIEKAIQSVIAQHYPHVELIILDGGSTDNTLVVLKKYAQHITYWHSEPDGSAAAATNIGIQKARGDFIGLLMADDWYEPDIFAKIAAAYSVHPEVDMITCGGRIVKRIDGSDEYLPIFVYDDAKRMALTVKNVCFDITSAICCRFIKRELFERLDLFIPFNPSEKQFLTNDKEFLLRAIVAGVKECYVPGIGHTYLAHTQSFSFSNSKKVAMQHCAEHMLIVHTYLRKKLPMKMRCQLHYWYIDQSLRLVLYHLLSFNLKNAFIIMINGIKNYPLFWGVGASITLCKIILKKTFKQMKTRGQHGR